MFLHDASRLIPTLVIGESVFRRQPAHSYVVAVTSVAARILKEDDVNAMMVVGLHLWSVFRQELGLTAPSTTHTLMSGKSDDVVADLTQRAGPAVETRHAQCFTRIWE